MSACTNKSFIDVIGLCDPSVFDLATYPYWTQISIPESLILPEQKPDIEQINSVNISVEILRKKVIVTPNSDGVENQEGKLLTGRKLIVEGQLCQTINYTAAVPEQSVHSAHFVVPFSAFIVLADPISGTDPLDLNFDVNACVEDVFILNVCPRQIFKNVTLFLQAVPAAMTECPDNC
ncbi:MAG: DUF3794 domain-containing protein [Marinisporobacter sp.]|jgi:hypothetical protein|nr:DUF3794 domain-containing protein [Marinisporobacter sp.]